MPAERLLYLLAEYQAGGIARNSGQWHQVLRSDPERRFMDPDDDAADEGGHALRSISS